MVPVQCIGVTENNQMGSTMNDQWRLLSWEDVCELSSGINHAYEKASSMAEYGVNFFEFIHTNGELAPIAQRWWDGLTVQRRAELLIDARDSAERRLAELQDAVIAVVASRGYTSS